MITAGNLQLDESAVLALCERYHVRELALFGSVLRDDYAPNSDVDGLVDFDLAAKVTLLHLGGLQMDLQDLFGRAVDVLTKTAALRARLRDAALKGRAILCARPGPHGEEQRLRSRAPGKTGCLTAGGLWRGRARTIRGTRSAALGGGTA